MIRLKKSHLVIIFLSFVLAVLVVQLLWDNSGHLLRKVFSEDQDKAYFPNLIAPEREIRQPPEGEKICYLTFDDGPSENTGKILDILSEHQAKATFFVIGQSLNEETKPLLERMIEEGHAIGMHANVHSYEKLYESLDSFLADYDSLYKTLKEDYGIETALFRFPGGSACNCLKGQGKNYVKEMEERGFSCFDWKCSGEDSVGKPTVYSIQKNVFATGLKYHTTIVLLHDSSIADQTVEALPGILERFEKEGYSFESLENAKSYVFPASR